VAVAMLDFLQYPKYLQKTYSLKKEQIYRHIAQALSIAIRTVKGHLLGLNPASKEDTYRYSAIDFITEAKKFYNSLLS
jgi:hypothetical protein